MLNLETNIPNTVPGVPLTEFGQAINDFVPGDNLGTPLIEKWLNDHYYAFYAILFKAGITPSGQKENTSASDFYDALKKLMEEFMSADFLNPTPQDVPNNTVLLSKGVTRDPNDPTSEPVQMAANGASALPLPGVTGDFRRDRFVFDKLGNIIQKLGVQGPASLAPAILEGEGPICSTLISTIGAPVIDNVQDFVFNERIMNRLPKLDDRTIPGKVILSGRIAANGSINKTTAFLTGAAFSVVKSANGQYDVTISGVSGTFSNVHILANKNNGAVGGRGAYLNAVSDNGSNTGYGTNTGFRISIIELLHLSCGGCPYLDTAQIDAETSFIVIGLD